MRLRTDSSVLAYAATTVAGFVVLFLGWRVANSTLLLNQQIPTLISGGLGGLALVVIGAGLLGARLTRIQGAVDKRDHADLIAAAAALVDARDDR